MDGNGGRRMRMTEEEAIGIMESYKELQIKGLSEAIGYEKEIREENLEAFTMAIAALKMRIRIKIKEE